MSVFHQFIRNSFFLENVQLGKADFNAFNISEYIVAFVSHRKFVWKILIFHANVTNAQSKTFIPYFLFSNMHLSLCILS